MVMIRHAWLSDEFSHEKEELMRNPFLLVLSSLLLVSVTALAQPRPAFRNVPPPANAPPSPMIPTQMLERYCASRQSIYMQQQQSDTLRAELSGIDIVRNYGEVRRHAESTGQQLDQLIDIVNRLKGARIAIGIQ
jgi:hypothetical protein